MRERRIGERLEPAEPFEVYLVIGHPGIVRTLAAVRALRLEARGRKPRVRGAFSGTNMLSALVS
jgi:hypothetical protein